MVASLAIHFKHLLCLNQFGCLLGLQSAAGCCDIGGCQAAEYLAVPDISCCERQEGPMADAKRKRVVPDDEQKGAARARAFLQDFSALPIDKMDPNEAVRKVRTSQVPICVSLSLWSKRAGDCRQGPCRRQVQD